MPVRLRKFVGGIAIVAFLIAYAVVAVMLFERLPDLAWLRLAYMAVTGIAWGVPLFPLISWMGRGR